MRRLLMIVFFFICLISKGQYYIDATLGNDANAGTIGSPWKTLSKANSFVYPANATIYLKRGEIFYGSLVFNRNNMFVDAYGSGAKPLITGFTTLTGWQSSGNGTWSVVVPNIKTTTFNTLVIDNQLQVIGRSPSDDAPNGGYLNYTDGSNLNGGADSGRIWGVTAGSWVGKDVVVRPVYWRIQKGRVYRQSGDTIYYRKLFQLGNGSQQFYDDPNPGYGYFFQNDSSYLNKFGEWHLDTLTKRLRVAFVASNPNSYVIRASTVDTLINCGLRTNITISNIDMEGGNIYGVFTTSTSNITIQNCKINNIGGQSIAGYRIVNFNILNDTITNSLSAAIYANATVSGGLNVTDCYIRDIGLYAGMGSYNSAADYHGMYVHAVTGMNILRNQIRNTGHDGMRWGGSNGDASNVLIKHNWVDSVDRRTQDGGCIYMVDNVGNLTSTNRHVDSNFLFHGFGNIDGTPTTTHLSSGIYSDVTANNTSYDGNVARYFPRNCITLNSPTNVTIRNSIFLQDTAAYYSVCRSISYAQVGNDFITGLDIKNNIGYIFATTQAQEYYSIGNLTGTLQDNVRAIGTIDSNYFNFTLANVWRVQYSNPGFNLVQNTLAQWQTLSLYDTHTTQLANKPLDSVQTLYNYSPNANNFVLTGVWKDVHGTSYSGTITLQPYSALFLMFYTGAPPVIPTPTTTSISPTNGTANGIGFTLTINGTNFQTGVSVGLYNGSPRTTTFVNANQIQITVTAADNAIANGGTTASITVQNTGNPTVSNAQTYTLNPITPTTTSISPTNGTANGSSFTLTVNGTNFINGISVVRINGSARTTVFISSTQLTATITGVDNAVANGGTTATITVLNTGNVTASNGQTYTFNPVTPTTTSISPTSGVASGSGFTLTVNGTNFINGLSFVYWNGSLRVTTFVNSTQLTAAITNADNAVANGGTTATVTVITTGNPVASNAQTYTLTPATPTTTSLSPSSGTANGGSFTLTVNGTNFISGLSVVRWNGSARTTTFVSSTQLTAIITATDNAIANGGTTATVTVINTGNVTISNSQTYTLTPITPTTTAISPTSGIANNVGFTLTIDGTGFINGISVGRWNGSARTTTFVSSTRITIAVTNADNASGGAGTTVPITVINTGNVTASNSQTYSLLAATPGTPSISSISPIAGTANGIAFTLTVNGADYANGVSVVQYNGSPRVTVFNNSGQITTTITAADNAIANGNSVANITVLNSGNPTPSNTQVYSLLAATPTTTNISPANGTANGSGFTLTVNGTNFINGTSTVLLNGIPLTTTFVNSGQLTAAVTSGINAISAGGSTALITVSNTGNPTASNAQVYTFTPITPTTSSISPTSDTADGLATVIIVNGTNFISGISTVYFGATALVTTFLSSTQLSAVITSSLNAISNGNTTKLITVLNNGNVTASNSQTYTLIPVPASISNINPTSGGVTGNSFVLTINGSNFISGTSIGYWNGSARATTFVNENQIRITVTGTDNGLGNAGTTANITVQNTNNSNISNSAIYSLTSPRWGFIKSKKIPVQR